MSDQEQNVNMPMRAKYWSELTSDEKIERARTMLRQLPDTIDQLSRELRELRVQFEEHTHSDGRVTIPVARRYNSESPFSRRRAIDDPECYI